MTRVAATTASHDYPRLIRAAVSEHLRNALWLRNDQREWLLTHPRLELLVTGLAHQFKLIEKFDHRFKGKPPKRETLISACSDFANIWAKGCIRERDESVMSSAAKQAIVGEQTRLAEFKNQVDTILEGEGASEEQIQTTSQGGEISKQTVEIDATKIANLIDG